MKVIHSIKFRRSLNKLPLGLVEKIIRQTVLFEKNPFNPRLRTHKLHGKLKNLWSFSIDEKHRILFQFGRNKNTVIFLDVGDHRLYQ